MGIERTLSAWELPLWPICIVYRPGQYLMGHNGNAQVARRPRGQLLTISEVYNPYDAHIYGKMDPLRVKNTIKWDAL